MGLLLGLGALSPGEAKACGGGMVSEVDADVSVGAQRVFVSVRKDGTTDIVTQLAVSGTADFGVLIPLPSAPTLDQTPIDTRELDALDAATQVHFFSREEASDSQGSGSSGCGSADAGDGELAGLGGRNDEGGGVTASEFLDVGPVTAVVLTADDGAALTAWLDENGFAVGTNDQSVVDAYVGQGRHFLAFKRAEGAPKTDTSVGVHFSLAGISAATRCGWPGSAQARRSPSRPSSRRSTGLRPRPPSRRSPSTICRRCEARPRR